MAEALRTIDSDGSVRATVADVADPSRLTTAQRRVARQLVAACHQEELRLQQGYVREGFARLELTVLSDACFNGSVLAEHELLLVEVFPTIVDVMTADQWVVQRDEAR
jgi:hypothetical protein